MAERADIVVAAAVEVGLEGVDADEDPLALGGEDAGLGIIEAVEPFLDGDDAKLESLWKKEHSLKEFLDTKHFKSYDTLKARLDKVLGLDGVAPIKTKAEDITPAMTTMSPDLDDELDYFKSLAED